jgi:putative oxidoreductase
MSAIYKFEHWGDSHHPKILDVIRMLLGIFLVIKGAIFLKYTPFLRDLIIENKSITLSPEIITALIYCIIYVHIVGGTLIFLGLSTRLASLFQLPIVFGAVFFVNILSSFVNSELWLSILILALLILFMVIGSGPLSLDRFLSKINRQETSSP